MVVRLDQVEVRVSEILKAAKRAKAQYEKWAKIKLIPKEQTLEGMPRIPDLDPGNLVTAAKIPAWVCPVPPGTVGVVFAGPDKDSETGLYMWGPQVRWFNGCCCNVYQGYIEERRS